MTGGTKQEAQGRRRIPGATHTRIYAPGETDLTVQLEHVAEAHARRHTSRVHERRHTAAIDMRHTVDMRHTADRHTRQAQFKRNAWQKVHARIQTSRGASWRHTPGSTQQH
jgi:hypothetical protein